jgi:hypothetical protein
MSSINYGVHPVVDKMIEARNAAFAKLSKANKCVEIAKEAIFQVGMKRFTPTGGVYCSINNRVPNKCVGCAMGGLFVGLVDGHLTRALGGDSAYAGSESIIAALAGAFTEEELRTIEAAFEGFHEYPTSPNWHRKRRIGKLYAWGDCEDDFNYADGSDRHLFLRICSNIIHNKGKFNPRNDPSDKRHAAIIAKYGAAKKRKKVAA